MAGGGGGGGQGRGLRAEETNWPLHAEIPHFVRRLHSVSVQNHRKAGPKHSPSGNLHQKREPQGRCRWILLPRQQTLQLHLHNEIMLKEIILVVYRYQKTAFRQARQDTAVKHKTELFFHMRQELASFCTVGFIFKYIHMEIYCVKLQYPTQHTKKNAQTCEKVYCAGQMHVSTLSEKRCVCVWPLNVDGCTWMGGGGGGGGMSEQRKSID